VVHEWALAEAVLYSLLDVTKKYSDHKIKEVVIEVGELQGIDLEVLKFALKELAKSLGLEDVLFRVEVTEAEFRCRSCGFTWKLSDVRKKLDEATREAIHFVPDIVHTFIQCPRCGSPDYEIVRGRGVCLKSILLEKSST